MNLNLENRLALVTGSTAGIGYATAEILTREGAQVVVNGRSQASVDEALMKIESVTGRSALGFAGDLSTAPCADELARRYPGVEILVNNLGIFELACRWGRGEERLLIIHIEEF